MIPQALLNGYTRFRRNRFRDEEARYRQMADGQDAETMVIACADSRVDPATIFAAAPGELFVVRNVAALVPPCDDTSGYHGTSAALEFAVTEIGVKNIVVLGHGFCGGVAASLSAAADMPTGAFIGPWMEMLSPERDRLLRDYPDLGPKKTQRALEWLGVLRSMENLRTFPFVHEAMEAGRLAVSGAWFSIAEAELYCHNADTGKFEPVSGDRENGGAGAAGVEHDAAEDLTDG